jgi:hypothetical protein
MKIEDWKKKSRKFELRRDKRKMKIEDLQEKEENWNWEEKGGIWRLNIEDWEEKRGIEKRKEESEDWRLKKQKRNWKEKGGIWR